MSAENAAFLAANGGMAMVGKSYGLGKPGAPKARDGKPIEIGKPFIDEEGRKVIKRINSKGEE